MVSADGKHLLLNSRNEPWVLYPATVFPTPRIDDPDGYSLDRNLGLYGSTPKPGSYTTAHDMYYPGAGDWYFAMPGRGSAWWKLKTLGSAPDGGPLYDDSAFPVTDPNHDFGEAWPVNAVAGAHRDPFGSDYWSHAAFDRWGRYVLHSSIGRSYSDPLGQGPGVWDIQKHQYVVLTFGGGCQHNDWSGFTDWTVSSSGHHPDQSQKIIAQKFDDRSSQIIVNCAYSKYDRGTNYVTDARPGQSPDGTKVAWHSKFLNGQNKTDAFWSVVYYPYPPTDLEASLRQWRDSRDSFPAAQVYKAPLAQSDYGHD